MNKKNLALELCRSGLKPGLVKSGTVADNIH